MTIQRAYPFIKNSIVKINDDLLFVLDTDKRHIPADGRSFGLDAEAGTLYLAEVRAATEEEASPQNQRDALLAQYRHLQNVAEDLSSWNTVWNGGKEVSRRAMEIRADKHCLAEDDDFIYRQYQSDVFAFEKTPQRVEFLNAVKQMQQISSEMKG